jgi:aspartyl-tRNA(Asn)/glutamyl-tRNA(Gln) amidotransferase subunit B
MITFEPVIGLEVHIHLSTQSKIFCGCSAQFGAAANTQVCPVCLGLPGSLPVLNRQAVEFAIRLALATHSRIRPSSTFARKNYFYPDLPKGYQISQFEEPFCEAGYMDIPLKDGREKRIRIHRIHLEEDAGKSIHAEAFVSGDETLIDLNRCGVPLLEIVSEPDLSTPEEAHGYLSQIRRLVRYLNICDGNMEEGSLRCDANVSIRPQGETRLGVKTEVKNMNSFQHVQAAIAFEIQRQTALLNQGRSVEQITLLWDSQAGRAEPMRSKEHSHDYRYFPEPDLPDVRVSDEWIARVRAALPELAAARIDRYMNEWGLPRYDAEVLTQDREIADYFEETSRTVADKKLVSNWVMGEVLRTLKESRCSIKDIKITPSRLSSLLNLISSHVLNQTTAKKVFEQMLQTDADPQQVMKAQGLEQISDQSELTGMIEQVLAQREQDVIAFLQGKDKVFGFLLGEIMKASAGKANPKTAQELLRRILESKRRA